MPRKPLITPCPLDSSMRGLIISYTRCGDSEALLRRLLAGWGLRLNESGRPGVAWLEAPEPVLIGLLESWRTGSLPMPGVSLVRPFDVKLDLHRPLVPAQSVVVDSTGMIEDAIRRLLTGRGIRGVRVRARGYGLGVSNTLRGIANGVLNDLGIRVSRSSSMVLSVEALLRVSGFVSVFIGLYPRRYLVRPSHAYLGPPALGD